MSAFNFLDILSTHPYPDQSQISTVWQRLREVGHSMDIGSLILPGQTGDTGRSPLPQQNARRQPQQPQVRIPQVIDLTEDDERSSNRPPFGPRDRQLPPMGFTSPQLLGHQQIIDVESYVPERHSSPPLQITGTTHNLTIAPFGRPGPSNPPPLPPYNSSLIWSGPPHLSTATRPLVNGRPMRLFADMNPESIRRQMMVQPSEYESWAPRMIQGFAREGLLAPHAPITLPRTMDYSSGGFPLYDEPPLGPPTGAHSVAPPQLPALETGFSRAPEEDEAAVCALCDQILCQGENPGERTLFILPKCGHVICGRCAKPQAPSRTVKKTQGPQMKALKCPVADCRLGMKPAKPRAAFTGFD